MLARRELSTHELLRKLQNKPFDIADIQYVIQALIQEGLVNDTRFAEHFIYYRRNKGYGPIRIRLELIEKGIKEDLIDTLIDSNHSAWTDEAFHVWQKRFKNQQPDNFKMKAKQMRFLQYRGFTNAQIESIFNQK